MGTIAGKHNSLNHLPKKLYTGMCYQLYLLKKVGNLLKDIKFVHQQWFPLKSLKFSILFIVNVVSCQLRVAFK